MFDSVLKHLDTSDGSASASIIDTKYEGITTNAKIKKLLDSAKNIYIGADWHLYQWWSDAPWKNTLADKILKLYAETVQPDDAYIYLGDLVSGEITDRDSIRQMMAKIPNGHKIFVRGNNDLFEDEFYLELGFEIVCDKFTYKDTIFTHIPIEKSEFGPGITKNAHGHIHFSRQYYVRYFNHMDVCTKANRCKPLLLSDMYENLKDGKYRPITI